VQAALARRLEGVPPAVIAAELGVPTTQVLRWFATFRRRATAADIDLTLDQVAVPLALDNLVAGLVAGDQTYTLETLKGRGQFRRHALREDAGSDALPALTIKFEGGPAASPTEISVGRGRSLAATGQVVGTIDLPKYLRPGADPVPALPDPAAPPPSPQPPPPTLTSGPRGSGMV
jgi:hypothetical protein